MTPTAPELLNGCVAALSTPPSAEEAGAPLVSQRIGDLSFGHRGV